MIDVYYWPTSNGRKITIMLEEAGLPYNIIPVNFTRGGAQTPEFLRINPNGKIPAIIDNDVTGGGSLTIFESAAILQYLAEKSGKLLPTDVIGKYNVLKWLIFQAANVGPLMGQFAHFHDYAKEQITYALNRYGRETERLYRVLEGRLGEAPYLAGENFSIADISTWTWIAPSRQEQRWEDWPNLKRWHDVVGARPAVQRGNSVRLDLQGIGPQRLDEAQWNGLYGWQQAPRT
jgi:GST-like protein